jgi:glycosyltransferase involved in cell wall biosynthesis
MYTAQNVDKRFPPPFCVYETMAYRRVSGLYPCSRQAAAVARGKGFAGEIDVIPLGYDGALFRAGAQSLEGGEILLALVGRFVPEKGLLDAVSVLARIHAVRDARLVLVGEGAEGGRALDLARTLGMRERVQVMPWQTPEQLAEIYRAAHVVLLPSTATSTWVEQFGRVIVEAQASGAVVAGYASGAILEVGGDAAVLVPERRVDLLAERLQDLLTDGSSWQRHRRAGLELAQSRTWERVAARQLDLYSRVIAGPLQRSPLPHDARTRRRLARLEFGPTATTPAGKRPFALPILRRGGWFPNLLGRAIDLARMAAPSTLRR